MIAAVLLAARLVGIVDQIDGGQALVEWEGRAFSVVPTAQLPAGVGEGDRFVLRPSRKGLHFELPWEVAADAERPYVASLHPKRGRDRPPWRMR